MGLGGRGGGGEVVRVCVVMKMICLSVPEKRGHFAPASLARKVTTVLSVRVVP